MMVRLFRCFIRELRLREGQAFGAVALSPNCPMPVHLPVRRFSAV